MKRSAEDEKVILDLEQDHFRDITEFKYDGDNYVLNSKMRTFFNTMFSAQLHAVYTMSGVKYDTKNGLDWSSEKIILVNGNSKVVHLTNSEWASFNYL